MLTASLVAFRFLLSAWIFFPRRLRHIPSLPLFAALGTACGCLIVISCAYWPEPFDHLSVEGLIVNRIYDGTRLTWANDTDEFGQIGEIPPELYPIDESSAQPLLFASNTLPLDGLGVSEDSRNPFIIPPSEQQPFPTITQPPKPALPRVDGIYHIVQRNENFYNIAQAYGVSHTKVIAYNQSFDPHRLIPNKDKIFIPHARAPIEIAKDDSMIRPLPYNQCYIISGYGYRKHPIGGHVRFHHGIDMPALLNTPIYSVLDGTVITVNNNTRSLKGRYVVIAHDNGLETVYGHCNQISVKRGQRIKQGERIACVGRTGRSTGYHLHFEVHKDGKYQNPEDYLTNLPHKWPPMMLARGS